MLERQNDDYLKAIRNVVSQENSMNTTKEYHRHYKQLVLEVGRRKPLIRTMNLKRSIALKIYIILKVV